MALKQQQHNVNNNSRREFKKTPQENHKSEYSLLCFIVQIESYPNFIWMRCDFRLATSQEKASCNADAERTKSGGRKNRRALDGKADYATSRARPLGQRAANNRIFKETRAGESYHVEQNPVDSFSVI